MLVWVAAAVAVVVVAGMEEDPDRALPSVHCIHCPSLLYPRDSDSAGCVVYRRV